MSVVECLLQLGGVARRSALLRMISRAELQAAVDAGLVMRTARGVYALPQADHARRVAARLGGVLCLTSAALEHGWAVKSLPDLPHVIVSRGRKVGRVGDARLHYAELGDDQVDGFATSAETTLEHCLRRLPFDEALCVADSARREGVGASLLEAIADRARGPGSPQIRRVAEAASPLAANPFESALRAIALDVPGLDVQPQVDIIEPSWLARPDLVDVSLRIVLEADSFEWHGGRAALAADARRYNLLVVHGWIVLRFSWEDVMFHPEMVRDTLLAAVALAELLNEVGLNRGAAA